MTTIAIWKRSGRGGPDCIWAAGDTRLMDERHVLSDEAAKVLPLSVGPSGWTVGYAFAGSALLGYQTHAAASIALRELKPVNPYEEPPPPTLRAVADYVNAIAKRYRSRLEGSSHSTLEMAVFGYCPRHAGLGIFVARKDGLLQTASVAGDALTALGLRQSELHEDVAARRARLAETDDAWEVAPLRAVESAVSGTEKRIGGAVQVITVSELGARVFGSYPFVDDAAGPRMLYGLDLDALGAVGDWAPKPILLQSNVRPKHI